MPPREEKKHKWVLFDILDYRKNAEFCYFLHKILAYVKKKQYLCSAKRCKVWPKRNLKAR